MANITGYDLSRCWFDFCFENTSIISPTHTALYMFIIEHNNRLGWKKEFGLPRQMCMDAIGIKNHRTFTKVFKDLIDWGFIVPIQLSKNQYTANIIALVKNTKATTKALDKAMQKQLPEQSTGIVCIDKPINKEPINKKKESKEKEKRFSAPSIEEVEQFFIEKGLESQRAKKDSIQFWNYYDAKGWLIGKNRMQNWKSAASGWINRQEDFETKKGNKYQGVNAYGAEAKIAI